jgi:hypothetical protein
MTYNFNEIHLADPGHEMQSLCDASQLLGHVLTVACLRSIQNEGVSTMGLASGPLCHDGQFEMGEEDICWQASYS